MGDIGYFDIRVLQQFAGSIETCLFQYLGITGTAFGEPALQAALAGIAQLGREPDA